MFEINKNANASTSHCMQKEITVEIVLFHPLAVVVLAIVPMK